MFARYAWVLSIVAFLIFSGCVSNPGAPAGNGTQIANPASVFCIEKGHSLEIRNGPAGQTGFCVFGNGSECEEWAYFRGECSEVKKPAANTTVPAPPALANEGGLCSGIAGIRCAEGLECKLDGNYPDAGGLCVKKAASAPQFINCPAARGDICTMEYNPVCGRTGTTPSTYDYEDYPSPCVACSKSSPALSYVEGECAAHSLMHKARNPQTLYECPSVRFSYCTNETDPVCGRLVDPTSSLSAFRNFQNPCDACAVNANAIAYYVGTCESRGNN